MSSRIRALLLSTLLLIPAAAQDDSALITSSQILNTVVTPPLTRSLAGPATEIREGLQFEGGTRGFGSETRSLTMVATRVKVESQANISLSIRFQLGSSTALADAASARQLNELLAALKQMPAGAAYLIEGHTCVLGSTELNDRLSLERANFIADYLIQHGVPATALRATGCGSAQAHAARVKETDGEAVLAPYRKVMLFKVMK